MQPDNNYHQDCHRAIHLLKRCRKEGTEFVDLSAEERELLEGIYQKILARDLEAWSEIEKGIYKGWRDLPGRQAYLEAKVRQETPAQSQTKEIRYVLTLQERGRNELMLISQIRALTGIGLEEARRVIHHIPVLFMYNADKATADKTAARLRSAGAQVSVEPITAESEALLKKQTGGQFSNFMGRYGGAMAAGGTFAVLYYALSNTGWGGGGEMDALAGGELAGLDAAPDFDMDFDGFI